eukprot:3266844-Rhodomonas_salina.3
MMNSKKRHDRGWAKLTDTCLESWPALPGTTLSSVLQAELTGVGEGRKRVSTENNPRGGAGTAPTFALGAPLESVSAAWWNFDDVCAYTGAHWMLPGEQGLTCATRLPVVWRQSLLEAEAISGSESE